MFCFLLNIACTQEEVNAVMELAKSAQKSWAKTPLWKRAELLHKAAAILKDNKAPMAESLVKEIAKPAKDSVTEVSLYPSLSFETVIVLWFCRSLMFDYGERL